MGSDARSPPRSYAPRRAVRSSYAVRVDLRTTGAADRDAHVREPADGRCASADSSAIELLGRPPRTSTWRSSAFRRSSCRRCCRSLGKRRAGRPGVPGLQAGRDRRGAAAPRIEDRPRAQGLHGRRRSVDAVRGGGAAARLHHQRDRLGSAHRRVPGSVQRPRGPRTTDPACGRSETFADDSLRVLRALQFAARFELTLEPDSAPSARRSRSTICRPSESGASSRSCCWWPSGRRSASRSRASWA